MSIGPFSAKTWILLAAFVVLVVALAANFDVTSTVRGWLPSREAPATT